jgi:hypothetical protein
MLSLHQSKLRYLIDRQAILDCLTRYCRGVDRFDRDLLLSAYHPDATDNHGVFIGSPVQFAAWGLRCSWNGTTAGKPCHCESHQ